MDERLINIDSESPNQSVFRVMPVVRLFEILESGCLTLVEPKAWDDPFENILLGGHMPEVLERDIGAKIFGISAFGQCWTTNQETDAMWRIYSQDKQGVKVKSSILKLVDALSSGVSDLWKTGCFIGKVQYHEGERIIEELKKVNPSSHADIARSLLLKRTEFEHEQEVRLILTMGAGSTVSIEVDAHELIDEIVFDPRIDRNIYEAFSKQLVSLGYKKEICQSAMYTLPSII